MRYRLQRHDGTDCSATMVPITVLRMVPIQRYRQMFGMTAKMWRKQHPELKGNIRDYASINELICLSNMENLNAVFIDQGIPQGERLIKLNQIAIQQMKVLEGDNNDRKLLK